MDIIEVRNYTFTEEYSQSRRLLYGMSIIAIGIMIAGFWNYHLVDGFGRDLIAGKTIGDTNALAGTFGEHGGGFGFIFAAIAGLAATFTACNCVAFTMLPGLACSSDGGVRREAAWSALLAFTIPVACIGAAYGIFVGFLGPDGVAAINERPVRIAQAQAVFSIIGVIMLFWGLLELGFFKKFTDKFSPVTIDFFSSSMTKAAIMGSLVGLFAVGRPFPVFREFLTYAASAQSPSYGAAVMIVHGMGQIVVLLALFALLIYFGGNKMMRFISEKPNKPRLITALALLGGGAYFVFYWGIAFIYDVGRWGFKLGWY